MINVFLKESDITNMASMVNWLNETFGHQYYTYDAVSYSYYKNIFANIDHKWFAWPEDDGYTFHFKNKEDAILFKLTWGGK